MKNNQEIKEIVREKYASIAIENKAGCCGETLCCSGEGETDLMNDAYDTVEGHFEEADLALGCGIPTEFANISKGETVIDLGAGAGNDVFVARQIVGDSGKGIGGDMTQEMIDLAEQNKAKLGFQNVSFIKNDIEDMKDVPNDIADVVISNCVLNLVPNKPTVFNEIHRVLKEGGHFCISDIVRKGTLPSGILKAGELYAGCVSGASDRNEYLGYIKAAGFKNMILKKEKLIELPDDILLQYITPEDLTEFRNSKAGIYSITVYADKLKEGTCC